MTPAETTNQPADPAREPDELEHERRLRAELPLEQQVALDFALLDGHDYRVVMERGRRSGNVWVEAQVTSPPGLRPSARVAGELYAAGFALCQPDADPRDPSEVAWAGRDCPKDEIPTIHASLAVFRDADRRRFLVFAHPTGRRLPWTAREAVLDVETPTMCGWFDREIVAVDATSLYSAGRERFRSVGFAEFDEAPGHLVYRLRPGFGL
jgi:hypothetical protein